MNRFCYKDCTGRSVKEIRMCKDRNCPFYPFRYANIDHKDDKEIAKKLRGKNEEST